MRLKLREIEDVVDEPLEPARLGLDNLERVLAQGGVGDDALAQSGEVAADLGQRRAQLVSHRHQEVPFLVLGLGEPAGHLAEALCQMPDLARRALW